jgi:hypothetical protein
MFTNKNNMINYLIKHNKTIKSIDSAIPLEYLKKMAHIGINKTFYVTVYYTNGSNDILNLLDEIVYVYNNLYLDYINNFLNYDTFTEYYNLDFKEISFINTFFNSSKYSLKENYGDK